MTIREETASYGAIQKKGKMFRLLPGIFDIVLPPRAHIIAVGSITRTVANHIAKLRQKIEPSPSEPQHIIPFNDSYTASH